jgi:hypothetical protein
MKTQTYTAGENRQDYEKEGGYWKALVTMENITNPLKCPQSEDRTKDTHNY